MDSIRGSSRVAGEIDLMFIMRRVERGKLELYLDGREVVRPDAEQGNLEVAYDTEAPHRMRAGGVRMNVKAGERDATGGGAGAPRRAGGALHLRNSDTGREEARAVTRSLRHQPRAQRSCQGGSGGQDRAGSRQGFALAVGRMIVARAQPVREQLTTPRRTHNRAPVSCERVYGRATLIAPPSASLTGRSVRSAAGGSQAVGRTATDTSAPCCRQRDDQRQAGLRAARGALLAPQAFRARARAGDRRSASATCDRSRVSKPLARAIPHERRRCREHETW
jgi:hypothetical protein